MLPKGEFEGGMKVVVQGRSDEKHVHRVRCIYFT